MDNPTTIDATNMKAAKLEAPGGGQMGSETGKVQEDETKRVSLNGAGGGKGEGEGKG